MEKLKCNDCQRPISDRAGRITECASAKLGTYYDGPPICDRCAEKRYEQAIIDKEAEAS